MPYISSEAKGELSERMLTAAVEKGRPRWLKRAERASSFLNVKGVDVVAHIVYPDGRTGRVLIQIKSSEKGREEYFNTHPWAKDHQVVCLVISLDDHHVTIRRKLYPALQDLRERNVWHEGCLGWLENRPLSVAGEKLQKKIEAAQLTKFTNPCMTTPPKFLDWVGLWWQILNS